MKVWISQTSKANKEKYDSMINTKPLNCTGALFEKYVHLFTLLNIELLLHRIEQLQLRLYGHVA